MAYSNHQMSVFIPSVTETTTEEQVKQVFYQLWLGDVNRVDFVKRQDNDKYMAFVHFNYWFNHPNAYGIQEQIAEKGQSKIVYNDPHYWILMENHNPRSEVEKQMEERIKELEERVDSLTKRNEYLNTVMETQTRNFMDNNIVTKDVRNCVTCYTEMETSRQICPACNREQPPSAITSKRTPEQEEAEALAMTGALDSSYHPTQRLVTEYYSPEKEEEPNTVPMPKEEDISAPVPDPDLDVEKEQKGSSWWIW